MDRDGFICRDTCARQPAVRVRQLSAPIAASLPRREPVVTLRAEPIAAGFSSPFSPWRDPVMSSLAHHTVQPRNTVRPSARSPTGVVCPRAQPAHPRALGIGSTRWVEFPQEAPSKPRAGAAAASSKKKHCTNREWCPGSLVDLVPPTQARRTETLTGQAAHTSSSKAASGRRQNAMDRIGKGIDGS